ncbi:AAA family ATPase [Mesorhizobium sp. CO1-1-11]|uniref:ATP-dependent nuclease n=1 Tax=Mesorhizobium sp. CO1-1-11 TaxID=2876636 RepID=UPI001CC91D88|nr:AAA family ATPase [Mesorhizobium sp. CO1-1-11]MBZ9724776.1 AAA family ATPase [Mesorhizobium sp. CO1-1-11]
MAKGGSVSRFFDDLQFNPSLEQLLEIQKERKVTVLTGYNNSGKSAYLKKMAENERVLYLGPNRFYSFHFMSLFNHDENELSNFRQNMFNQRQSQYSNFESSFYDTNRALTRLTNERRQKLFEVFQELFGVEISVRSEFENNEFSNRYVNIDGDSLSVTSSGTRLFLGVLAALMDERFQTVALDEPELGLSPVLQTKLAPLIVARERDDELFPHNPRFLITTHSHSFLDKGTPSNNFIVSRNGNNIQARQCLDKQELIDIHFRMLGNDLGNLYLPDAIIFVEGETDKIYIQRVLCMLLPNHKIVVESSGGDIAARLNSWSSALGDLQTGPYRRRTFVVADAVMQSGLQRLVERLGIPVQNVVKWDGNGIEYVYPPALLGSIFGATVHSTSELIIVGDRVSAHGVTKTKMELAQALSAHITSSTEFPREVQIKLLGPLRNAIVPDH